MNVYEICYIGICVLFCFIQFIRYISFEREFKCVFVEGKFILDFSFIFNFGFGFGGRCFLKYF